MRRAVAVLSAIILTLLVVVLSRTLTTRSRQLTVETGVDPAVDRDRVAAHLAGAIRIPTISNEGKVTHDDAAFRGFAAYLEQTYTLVRTHLERESVANYSLLYTWRGSDPKLAPILLAAHMDVVPVDPASAGKWTHPPFEGAIADGYLWGRGALDDKAAVIGIMEAVESLLASGAAPKRTVYLAFGHDEELTGTHGAANIVALLKKRGVQLEYALDEGGFVTNGIIPGIRGPAAVVAVSEKGYLNVELKVAGTGGHSSAPPEHTAVGVLAAAIQALERQPFPTSIRPPQTEFFDYTVPEMNLGMRLALSNRWLFQPLVMHTLEKSPLTRATLHTTIAATMIEGSPKSNVLPTEARAIVNLRLMPGDHADYVLDHIRRAIDNTDVQIRAVEGYEASPVSDIEAPPGVAIQRAIREVFRDTIVAPSLMTGASDVRYYAQIAVNAYRFVPVTVGPDVSLRAHGIDERVLVSDLDKSVRFYARLLADTATR